MSKRTYLLISILAACALLVINDRLDGTNDSALAQDVQRRQTLPAQSRPVIDPADADQSLDVLEPLASRANFRPPTGNAFPAVVPPPLIEAALAVAPVARATAPSLPFKLIGKKKDGEVWEVYLSEGDTTHIVRLGDTVNEAYKVRSIDPPTMVLSYLPLDQDQSMNIGPAPEGPN